MTYAPLAASAVTGPGGDDAFAQSLQAQLAPPADASR